VFGWFGGPGSRVIAYLKQASEFRPRNRARGLHRVLRRLAMIVGLLVRPVRWGFILVMLVAIAKVHWHHGFFLNWSLEPGKGHGFEMNLALIGMAAGGSRGRRGALSIDRCLRPW